MVDSWRSPVSFSVWLQLTHVAERNMWQHLQSLQRILLLHCTLLMYFSPVYFLIVFLNCISQVHFSRGQLKHVTTYAVYATDPSSLLVNQTFSRFFYFCFLNEICSTLNLIASVKCTHYLCWSSDLQFFLLLLFIFLKYIFQLYFSTTNCV